MKIIQRADRPTFLRYISCAISKKARLSFRVLDQVEFYLRSRASAAMELLLPFITSVDTRSPINPQWQPREYSPAVRGSAVCRMHGARGGAPEGKRNGNYRNGGRTKRTMAALAVVQAMARICRQTIDDLPD
jgi:hypothetical protein